MKRFTEAQKAIDQALKINPQYFYAWLNKGLIYAETSSFNKAIDCFKKGYQIRPSDPNINYLLACMYSLVKMSEESIKYLGQAIKADRTLKFTAIMDSRFNNVKNNPRFKKLVEDFT